MLKDQESNEFSWTTFFIVTGSSFMLFSGILAFLDDYYTSYFIYAGFVTLFSGIVAWIAKTGMVMAASRKRN